MLILSQDKEKIINFDNVIQIYINTYANEYPDISCDTVELLNINLGDYKTLERAKEVLQEIIKAYIENKKGESANSMFGCSIIPNNTYYEMPEK